MFYSLCFFSYSLLLIAIGRKISNFTLSTKSFMMHKSQFGWMFHGLRKKFLKFLFRVLFLLMRTVGLEFTWVQFQAVHFLLFPWPWCGRFCRSHDYSLHCLLSVLSFTWYSVCECASLTLEGPANALWPIPKLQLVFSGCMATPCTWNQTECEIHLSLDYFWVSLCLWLYDLAPRRRK